MTQSYEENTFTQNTFISSDRCARLVQMCIYQITAKIVLNSLLIKNVVYHSGRYNQGKKAVICYIPLSALTSIARQAFNPSISWFTVCAWLRLCISSEQVTYSVIIILKITETGSIPMWWTKIKIEKKRMCFINNVTN